MENESKNNEVVKPSKWDVFYILLSFLLWGVWLGIISFGMRPFAAITILIVGLMMLMSGMAIGIYQERREAAEKKQDGVEKNEKSTESKNNEVVKLSKWSVLYILISFILWVVWTDNIGSEMGTWSAIGILGQGTMLLASGMKIGGYQVRCEAAEKKEDEEEKNEKSSEV